MTPFRMVCGLEALVLMEFMVSSLRMAMDYKVPTEEAREQRIEPFFRLEEDKSESALLKK